MKSSSWWLVSLVSIWAAGCEGGGTPPTDQAARPSRPAVKAPAAAEAPPAASNAFPTQLATATIAGKILFDGAPPPREPLPAEKIVAAKDRFCEHHHTVNPVLPEDLIVGKDKAVRNVLVYVKAFPQEWTHPTPSETVVINQKGCVYVPHVLGVMANQPVVVTSEDDTAHNVHLVAKRNRGANFVLAKGQRKEMSFTRPELGSVYFKCDIHSWMRLHVGVFTHPFFAVTSDDGTFKLGKLPPGEYEIEAWHETLGSQPRKITLKDGETIAADFAFKKA